MSANDPKPKSETEKPAAPLRQERGKDEAPEKLDFAKLDLSIEKIEERISPSETNVFDK